MNIADPPLHLVQCSRSTATSSRPRTGGPARVLLGGRASFIDFNNSEAKEWWKSQLQEQYLDHGCTGIWNDNNELELEDIELEAYPTKTLYPIKMAEASYEVFKQHHPERRPWIYSRSGYAGLQRFARTWTGDNVSDWKTLKYSQYMGIGLGLSGLPSSAADLGGFFGSFPEEELLVLPASRRSCRALRHPLMARGWQPHRAVVLPPPPSFRSAPDHQHYRFMPYIYTCAYQSAAEGSPSSARSTLSSRDENIRSDEVNSLFGPNLLKVIVTDKGSGQLPSTSPVGCGGTTGTGPPTRGGPSSRSTTRSTALHSGLPGRGASSPQQPPPPTWRAASSMRSSTSSTPASMRAGRFAPSTSRMMARVSSPMADTTSGSSRSPVMSWRSRRLWGDWRRSVPSPSP